MTCKTSLWRWTMMQPLHILLLEDSLLDAELIQANLRASWSNCKLTRVENRADFLAALESHVFDLILSDYSLPKFDGLAALKIVCDRHPEIPFIFVSANLGEEVAIETLRNGATDYVLKQRLERLAPVAERAVREARERTERKWIEQERAQLLTRQRQYTGRLRKLAKASLAINSLLSIDQTLKLITDQSREIIEAHQAVISMTTDGNWAQAINATSLSEKYARWRDYEELPDGSGIYSLVCRMNRPMRMTQAELESHPDWRGFGREMDRHPPMRGWLAVPLISRQGNNIGLIQLSDKYEGEFTEEDEAILVQLAQVAAVAIDNARLYLHSQETNRIKDEFLATLSHELRSPLNPILGWSKLLQTKRFDETTLMRALQTIERNAKLQTHLIEDLLDISRIIQGKLALKVSSVNLIAIVEAAIDTMRPAADAKSILLKVLLAEPAATSSNGAIVEPEWKVDADSTLFALFQTMGDPNRLQQIIWNLLSNAIKFTPQGGQVEIRLSLIEPEATLTAGMSKTPVQARYAEIAISDTGKGIKPDFLPYIFDYFRQADASITRVYGGLGLGLAIVRHLTELHGGTICAESFGEGQGATFTIRLPLLVSQPDSKELGSSTPAINLEGIQAVVVDDEVDTREIITLILEGYGTRVISAASASEALEAVEQFTPNILVSDIGMPLEDGYSLIRKVRELAPDRGGMIPAIALTAYARPEDQHQAVAAGFQLHLPKPVEPEKLAKAVAELVGRTPVG
ncbi:MAG: response regulator [Leptolyngbyaceae cyanobacterium RM2_2_4]|nr:response regulator [Leptolyngbyaceae cyanobacterium SM1_4_3]NJN57001.1 response regulator [Leptolyngbyaceae cyanobacterium SL_5_9]NJO52148.1 response regulator [Leptolyngbyaceae cyanobacterium RM2_2_4]